MNPALEFLQNVKKGFDKEYKCEFNITVSDNGKHFQFQITDEELNFETFVAVLKKDMGRHYVMFAYAAGCFDESNNPQMKFEWVKNSKKYKSLKDLKDNYNTWSFNLVKDYNSMMQKQSIQDDLCYN